MRRTLFILSCTLLSGGAFAQVIWNEGVNGDLSNDRLNPTNLQLQLGVNSLMATSVQGDREYVHFHLGSGMTLNQVVLVSYQGVDEIAFIGVQAGSTFTEPPTGTNVANLLGYTHFGPAIGNVGHDILPAMGTGAGSIGFVPPLTGEDYTFWIQQTGVNAATYQFDFVVAPEPCSLLALAGAAFWLRRRSKTA